MSDGILKSWAEMNAEQRLAYRMGYGDAKAESAPLIEAIERWSEAYPLEAFPEPDHKATGHDPTLCSASMGRHVIGRLMEYLREGSQ